MKRDDPEIIDDPASDPLLIYLIETALKREPFIHPPTNILGRFLRDQRNETGLNQEELSMVFGRRISGERIRKIEKGEAYANVLEIHIFADYFDLNPLQLFLKRPRVTPIFLGDTKS